MFSAHRGVGSECDFHSQITKKTTLEPLLQFSSHKSEQIRKLTPKWTPKGLQNHSKIYQNPDLDPKVGCPVSLGTTVSRKRYQRTPKCTPRWSKWSLQVPQITACPILPLTSYLSTGGPAAGAKP